MSHSFGLVKFKKTGNIYYSCYNGTSDVMIPFLCTPEECYNKETDCYCAISYCRQLNDQHKTWYLPDNITDLDDIDIYSDYGSGFYWSGTGSESARMIDGPLMPFEDVEVYEGLKHGEPDWVKEFFERM